MLHFRTASLFIFISNLICFLLKNREYLIYYHQGRTFIRSLDCTIDSIKIHLLSTSTFVWWLKILSEPFTKSSKDNAMSIYSFLTHLSIIDFCLEFKLSPAFLLHLIVVCRNNLFFSHVVFQGAKKAP